MPIDAQQQAVQFINPYLDAFGQLVPRHLWFERFSVERLEACGRHEAFHRLGLVKKYSWSIPTPEAIDCIRRHSPGGVVEIGAGTGYWAYLLDQIGVQVAAFDLHPPGSGTEEDAVWHENQQPFFPVQQGGPESIKGYGSRTLMLSWPPYDEPMAAECLELYRDIGGQTVVYIGEGEGGCTGDERFHRMLADDWEEAEWVKIPQWHCIRDFLAVYRRTDGPAGR